VKEPLDLDGVIAESFEIMRPAAERGEVRLSVNLPADLPKLVADRRTVKQILLNLLSNAVKFSVSGGEVSTSARARANMMTIEIADNGIGIESDILPTVTDVFSRENANVHLAHEGSGLGLAIVKSLIEAHDGTLTIASEVNKGTTASIVLPLGSAGIVKHRNDDAAHYFRPRRSDDVSLLSCPRCIAAQKPVRTRANQELFRRCRAGAPRERRTTDECMHRWLESPEIRQARG
jgi:hypothetical protein